MAPLDLLYRKAKAETELLEQEATLGKLPPHKQPKNWPSILGAIAAFGVLISAITTGYLSSLITESRVAREYAKVTTTAARIEVLETEIEVREARASYNRLLQEKRDAEIGKQKAEDLARERQSEAARMLTLIEERDDGAAVQIELVSQLQKHLKDKNDEAMLLRANFERCYRVGTLLDQRSCYEGALNSWAPPAPNVAAAQEGSR